MATVALYIYIALGILIGVSEWCRRSPGEPLDAMTVFNAAYFVLFVFVPINVMCFGEDVVRQNYAYETYGSGDAWTAFSLLFCYVLFCLGYCLKSPKGQKIGFSERTIYFSLQNSACLAKIIFFLGVLFMAIYALQVGGISAAISTARDVRYGDYIESKYVFVQHFCQFSADAFVLLFTIVLGRRARKIKVTTRDKVFLLSAFAFFVYYALSTAGRRPFIYPILLCYLVYWSLGAKMKKTAIAGLALIFVMAGLGMFLGPFVLSGDLSTVFDLAGLNRTDWRTLSEIAYDNATAGLGDSYIHFVAAQKAKLWEFGFLTDITNLPLDFFPSRLWGFEKSRNRMLDMTTEFIIGHRLREGVTGDEPLGLHGYLLVNFGYSGMFALFFVLGTLYRWIHNGLKPANSKDAVGWLIYWMFVLGFFVYLREGMLMFVLKDQLTWWVTAALLIIYRTQRKPARLGLSRSLLTTQVTTGKAPGYQV